MTCEHHVVWDGQIFGDQEELWEAMVERVLEALKLGKVKWTLAGGGSNVLAGRWAALF